MTAPSVDGIVSSHQLQETIDAIAEWQLPNGMIPWFPGGHIRIYSDKELITKATNAGLEFEGKDYAHGLHSPYWWIKCAVGVKNDDNPLVKAYHRLLVWDIASAPKATRWTEKALNPVLGKSLVVYATKPVRARKDVG